MVPSSVNLTSLTSSSAHSYRAENCLAITLGPPSPTERSMAGEQPVSRRNKAEIVRSFRAKFFRGFININTLFTCNLKFNLQRIRGLWGCFRRKGNLGRSQNLLHHRCPETLKNKGASADSGNLPSSPLKSCVLLVNLPKICILS